MNFAEFTLEVANGGLLRGRNVVTRRELKQAVWGSETFVDFGQGLTADGRRGLPAVCIT